MLGFRARGNRPDLRRIPASLPLAARMVAAAPVAVLSVAAALAQTASEVTPPSFEPQLRRMPGTLAFSGEPGLAAPEGADRLSISIAKVDVAGTLPGLEAETRALEQRLTRGPIAVSEIFEAASALEEAYVNAGFVLARVVLPAQNLADGGTLRLVVVDGFVESVDTNAVPAQVRDRLERLTDSLIGKRGLKHSELERQVLLAGDTYGIALESALATGTRPGGTIVILKPAYREITGFIGFDNFQSDDLGTWSLDAGLEFNGFLGLGEVFYIRGSGYPGGPFSDDGFFSEYPLYRVLAAGAVIPLNADGLSFNLELTRSDTGEEYLDTPTSSVFKRASARLFYPVVRSRAFNLTTQIGLDLESDTFDIRADAGDIPVYDDRLSVLRAAADASWLRPDGSAIDTGAIFSVGLDALGARAEEDTVDGTPLSRQGANVDFNKIELYGNYRRPVGEDFVLLLHARGQYSFGDPLLISEQIGIANFDEISTLGEGTLNGDSGWVVRGEIVRPVELDMADRPIGLRPYAFASTGAVYLEEPQFGEAATVRADAYGIGVETILVRDPAFSTASVRLELGRGYRDDGGEDGTRLSVVGSFRF